MTVYKRSTGYAAKFMLDGQMVWVPGSPFPTKSAAREAERRHRDQLKARVSDETCASFADRWLEEWPRSAASTRKLYATAAHRFAEEFGATPIGEVERLSARTWALGVPRTISKIIGTMYEDARNIGLVETNPFSNLRLPRTEKTEEVTPPTIEEFHALLRACTVLGGYAAAAPLALRARWPPPQVTRFGQLAGTSPSSAATAGIRSALPTAIAAGSGRHIYANS